MDYRTAKPLPARRRAARRMSAPVRYRVDFAQPESHLLRLSCRIDDPSPAGEEFVMPAWIPGSYLIRDFARHVITLTAYADGIEIPARKSSVHGWRVEAPAGTRRLEIDYEVYAWDLSVRGAHFDASHAFLNGTSVFLRVAGREAHGCELELVRPTSSRQRAWRVATTLPPAKGTAVDGFGRRRAADYFALIDHPVECGEFETLRFRAGSPARPHRVAISDGGREPLRGDLPRLRADLQRLCAWHLEFWGGKPPFAEYLFLLQLTQDGYGGLEHPDSTALIARRGDLPPPGGDAPGEGYERLLGLFSHEYFHAWLVKRIRPAGHLRPDLQQPAETSLLWLFEGFTAYYDDLALVRSGLITPSRYLALLAKTIARVLQTPGRRRQSIAEAGRDAWIKLYRPDENSENASISYYAKGSLVALALDLHIRRQSKGERSLDDLLRRLWQTHGLSGTPVDETAVLAHVEAVAGGTTRRFLQQMVHGTEDPPLQSLLKAFAVDWQEDPLDACATLGMTLAGKEPLPKITRIASGSAAEAAGLAGGDQLLAIDSRRADSASIDALMPRLEPGEKIAVHFFRDGALRTSTLTVPPRKHLLARLVAAPRAAAGAVRRRRAWLGA